MHSQSFRSNIMRQLLATARHQSRPPMALMGWLNELAEEEVQQQPGLVPPHQVPPHRHLLVPTGGSANSSETTTPAVLVRTLSTSNGSITSQAGPRPRQYHQHSQQSDTPTTKNYTSVVPETTLHAHKSNSSSSRYLSVAASAARVDSDSDDHEFEELELPALFQKLIRTRRSRSHFAPSLPAPSSSAEEVGSPAAAAAALALAEDERDFWKGALDRAAMCGYSAPNHKRTEPFTFKRILAPSDKASQLAEIAYRVNLRQQQESQKTQSQSQSQSPPTEEDDSKGSSARRKRDKWNQIPAFLVTSVKSHRPLIDPVAYAKALEGSPFDPLPFAPIQTEREMEDYASACAAVQNVLLSLHAEGIASKWATGPVVQTPAFRELVHAQPEDRVVALVMVGLPDESRNHNKVHHHSHSHSTRRRRHHRDLHGDVLVDL